MKITSRESFLRRNQEDRSSNLRDQHMPQVENTPGGQLAPDSIHHALSFPRRNLHQRGQPAPDLSSFGYLKGSGCSGSNDADQLSQGVNILRIPILSTMNGFILYLPPQGVNICRIGSSSVSLLLVTTPRLFRNQVFKMVWNIHLRAPLKTPFNCQPLICDKLFNNNLRDTSLSLSHLAPARLLRDASSRLVLFEFA
jgi:hypothetical protein